MNIFENFPQTIMSFVMSPQFEGWLFIARIAFIAFSIFLMGFIIFALINSSWLKRLILDDASEFLTYRPAGIRKLERDWRKITSRLDTGLESEYKLALIEADNIMDETLKRMGYGGETLGERLEKLTTATLPNIEAVKEAHKIRGNVIHDPDYRLSLDAAKKVLTTYEKAFRDIDAF